MPDLVRFLAHNAAIGFAAAIVFVFFLLVMDINGLWTLVTTTNGGSIAVFILTFFVGLTFASVQMGIAVMRERKKAPNTPRSR